MLDVNILVYAHREDSELHPESVGYVDDLVNGVEAFAVSDFVISGFLRVATNRRLPKPTPLRIALAFADKVRNQPHAVVVHPGDRHWAIFTGLCNKAQATGELIPDAYLAALAIEHGCEFVTCDKDFDRFEGLRWRSPLN